MPLGKVGNKSKIKGKVYLVGAGPGDPELLTKKAEKLIKKAEVILYDQLVGEALHKLFPKNAEIINVGKYTGKHGFEQSEINKMLVEYAKQGKVVVRLKGGDPYLFGRGGEEAEELVKAGIEVEVIPGITSAIAVPTYAGIPITHRDFASAVTFIAGHEDPSKEKSALNWDALAKLQGTLVILMGVGKLEENVKALLSHGKDPRTPVAIIERGTTREQRIITGNLKNITAIAKRRNVKPPAVIVIGEVVSLHSKLRSQKK
ncbi:MAG: uroporphyrinogen-III C-methyltransferase [Methanocellales archaeon]